MFAQLAAVAAVMAGVAQAQVTATGTMGTTNPPQATMGTPINQTSYSRLLSLNAIDDFCLFAPPEPNSVIGETEAYEVAWCIQPRNDARVIPDGTFTAVHLVKTPLYWQVQGQGDFTKINIQSGDQGGELDPHGATGDGNPVGGNVTCNATGTDVHYEEWMNYMSYNEFCLRICISENSTYSAAQECQHTLDEMGCEWVMPGDYSPNSFTECDADSAYPPGLYPLANGSTSTFAQRYTGTYTAGGTVGTFTVGQTITPQTPYSTPASSNCKTYTSVGNGIASLAQGGGNSTMTASSSGASMTATMSGMSGMSGMMSASMSGQSGAAGAVVASGKSAASGASGAVSSAKASGAAFAQAPAANFGTMFGGVLAAAGVVAGAALLI